MPERTDQKIEKQEDSPLDFLHTIKQLQSYKEWKARVPNEIRSLIEGFLLGKDTLIDKSDLPSVVEFYHGMRTLLRDPTVDPATLSVSPIIQNILRGLQGVSISKNETINIFSSLADPEIDFSTKTNYVEAIILPRIQFLRAKDMSSLSPENKDRPLTDITGEKEEEEYTVHRAPTQEGEGIPDHAIATVAPFFGGYYTDTVFDEFDPNTITWKQSQRQWYDVPEQELNTDKTRIYRSKVEGRGSVKLPHGWGMDRVQVVWEAKEPDEWELVHDQEGIPTLRVHDADESFSFSIPIAPSEDVIIPEPPKEDVPDVSDQFPEELLQFANELMGATLSQGVKLRRLALYIHKHLEYDTDMQWEEIYKADPTQYFSKIWEQKKAKCDEANTILARLLQKVGVHSRFIKGHSVQTKSPHGEALLLDGNRHGWAWGWDDEKEEWLRLDATPVGDPNVDQDEQQEELGEGDYGEQEAELMSMEQLDKKMKEREKKEEEERNDPVIAYAKEAGCTREQAVQTLGKIDSLRKKHARVLEQGARQWRTLVRANFRESIQDVSPVAMSEMDDVDEDELVSGFIEVLAGETDPHIGTKEQTEIEEEQWFGGYEVYIGADMSGSMNETIGGVKKADAQRDMVFLIVDSCMTAVLQVKKKMKKLKAPMPVKICVTVFGKKTEIVLPLTDQWGPKEQVMLYRALDSGAGSSTPDHLALQMLGKVIQESRLEEDIARDKKPAMKKHNWRMRRFVIMTADGGSDSGSAVQRVNKELTEGGIPVDLFLLASEDDANLIEDAKSNYPNVVPVPKVDDLAEKGLTVLTDRIRKAYGK